MALFLSASLCLCGSSAFANPRTIVARQSATYFNSTVVPQGLIVVPFAVPVAVPSYVQYQAVPSPEFRVPSSGSFPATRNPQPGTSSNQEPTTQNQQPAQPPASLVQKSCVNCHRGAEAKKGFRVDQPLSEPQRLKAISRLLADEPEKRMPKGKSLDAQTLGLLIQEFANPKNESAKNRSVDDADKHK